MKMESIPISNIQNVLYILITIFPEVVRNDKNTKMLKLKDGHKPKHL
jgi:hypothetical protein